jgi:hypothetical protein
MDVSERIFDDRSLPALGEHEADRRRIDGLVAHQVIDGDEMEIKLHRAVGGFQFHEPCGVVGKDEVRPGTRRTAAPYIAPVCRWRRKSPIR